MYKLWAIAGVAVLAAALSAGCETGPQQPGLEPGIQMEGPPPDATDPREDPMTPQPQDPGLGQPGQPQPQAPGLDAPAPQQDPGAIQQPDEGEPLLPEEDLAPLPE